jgi:hypothetical protein
MSKVGNKFITIKITHWLLIIYIGVLLLSTAIIPFISDERMERDTKEQVDIDKAMNELDKNLREGKLDQIDDQYFLKKNIFTDYKSQTLRIVSRSEYGPQIFVKRQKSNDSTIESFTYVNGFYIGGDDFSDKLIPYKLELSEDKLTITPKEQNIRLSISIASFPVRQFTGESIFNHSFSSGDQVLYLHIPSDLQLQADEGIMLEYVGE